VALDPDPAVVRLDNTFCDCQSEPDPAPVRRLRLPEPAKDVWQLLRRNPGAGIDHAKPHLSVDALRTHRDTAVARSELDRVADEVGQHLLNSCGIRVHHWKVVVNVGIESDSASRRQWTQHVDRIVDKRRGRLGFNVDREPARLHLLHVEQVLDHPVHAVGGPAHDLNLSSLLNAFHRRCFQHQTHRHRDGVEGVPEIVSDDRQYVVARSRRLLRLVKESRVLHYHGRSTRQIGGER